MPPTGWTSAYAVEFSSSRQLIEGTHESFDVGAAHTRGIGSHCLRASSDGRSWASKRAVRAGTRPLMSVEPGPGLFFFAAVVVLTMLAVESFDPRLIWDATSSKEVRYA
jgi:hypothetical protein